MIEFLRDWTINIVIMVVFVSFLQIILPSSNMKRYLNMIIGLLIIIVLINPFIKFISKDIDIEREVFTNLSRSNSDRTYESNEYSKLQNEQIVGIYKDKLKREIYEIVESKSEYQVLNLSIDILEDIDSEDFGSITRIEILMGEMAEERKEESENIKVEDVKPVSIDIKDTSVATKGTISKDCDKVQNVIAEYYRIPKENISVYLNTLKG